MSVIWLIESTMEDYSMATILMGNFPTQVFASIENAFHLQKLTSISAPDLILINLGKENIENLHQNARKLRNFLGSSTPVLITFSAGRSVLELEAGILYVGPESESNRTIGLLKKVLGRRKNQRLLKHRDIEFSPEDQKLRLINEGLEENIPKKEAQILKYLLENRDRCLTREELRDRLWPGLAISERTLDSHISRLRKRLIDCEVEIEAVYGGGYVLR